MRKGRWIARNPSQRRFIDTHVIYNLYVAHIYGLSTMLLKYFCKNFPLYTLCFLFRYDATMLIMLMSLMITGILAAFFRIFYHFVDFSVTSLTLVLQLLYCVAVIITIINIIAVINTTNTVIITIPSSFLMLWYTIKKFSL